MKRYFEFIGGDASRVSGQAEKFWEISLSKSEITIRFGKIGANGQTTLKTFPDAASASREAEKLIAEKLKKGYVEIKSSETPNSVTKPTKTKSQSDTKECVACAEDIKQNAKLCKHCGTSQDDPKFAFDDLEQTYRGGTVDRGETMFSKVTFVVQFDCLDGEINNLYNLDVPSMIDEVLDSTPIGKRIQRLSGEDRDWSVEGDISLRDADDYFAALKHIVRYEQLDVSFDGSLDGAESVSWPVLRKALLALRSERYAASQWWSAFEHAPVSISLKFLQPADQEKSVDVNSREALLEYLNQLEKSAENVEDIQSFLKFYGPEIESFRRGTSSIFLGTWFSTELLLTQTALQFETGKSDYFLAPTLDVRNFSWNAPSDQLPLLLEVDRATSPKNSLWFSPLPKNPYAEHSDWYWAFEHAINESERRGATGTEFNKLQFVVTMWRLNFFLDELGGDETEFPIEDFLERHHAPLTNVFELIEESNFQELDGPIAIPSGVSEFLEKLALPDNATEIWDDYLEMIGLTES